MVSFSDLPPPCATLSAGDALFPFHTIQCIIDRQELKIVGGEILELFF